MSLLFNGTTDLITGPSYTHGATTYTYAGWHFANTLGEGSFGIHLAHGVAGAGTGRFHVLLNNVTNVNSVDALSYWSTGTGQWISPANSVVLSTWQHIAATYDGALATNDASIYINGVSQAITQVGANPTGVFPTDTRVIYGGNNSVASGTFDGKLGEWALWNRILTATEINAVYLLGVLAVPNGLAIYWPMSGSVANAQDLSGNARHGTLTGTSLAIDPPYTPRGNRFIVI